MEAVIAYRGSISRRKKIRYLPPPIESTFPPQIVIRQSSIDIALSTPLPVSLASDYEEAGSREDEVVEPRDEAGGLREHEEMEPREHEEVEPREHEEMEPREHEEVEPREHEEVELREHEEVELREHEEVMLRDEESKMDEEVESMEDEEVELTYEEPSDEEVELKENIIFLLFLLFNRCLFYLLNFNKKVLKKMKITLEL